MTRGLPLFAVICVLASAPLYGRGIGQLAVAVLFGIWLLTPIKQASADRRSREAASPDWERG